MASLLHSVELVFGRNRVTVTWLSTETIDHVEQAFAKLETQFLAYYSGTSVEYLDGDAISLSRGNIIANAVSPIFVRVAGATCNTEFDPIRPTRSLAGIEFVQERELIVTHEGDLVPKSLGSNTLEVPKTLGRKVAGQDGKSQREFIHLNEHNRNPLARDGPAGMTKEEVAQHNKAGDVWIVIKGKVYDITQYVPYHPGGDIILTAAGSDGTTLFMEYHPWVNAEALIGKYQVGYIVHT
mmetsp:Transcript_19611/g.36052  ORF Transcript_19611/g.36052 Transcript_19611/m.36052 type:complete len:239 (+) Transcript_19611:4044-4760(+)